MESDCFGNWILNVCGFPHIVNGNRGRTTQENTPICRLDEDFVSIESHAHVRDVLTEGF